MSVTNWMSWVGGVDVAGATDPSLKTPNVIVHVARRVETPIGATSAGLIFVQPDSNAPPVVFGFVCEDVRVGAYFGPKIFAGTPFENASVLQASIEINEPEASATVKVNGHTITTQLSGLGVTELIHRAPGPMPFSQQGVERAASNVEVTLDGVALNVHVPAVGLSGGPGAVVAPCGVYAR